MYLIYMILNVCLVSEKHLVVDAFMKWQRSCEERQLLQKDMRSFLSFYRARIDSLEQKLVKYFFLIFLN